MMLPVRSISKIIQENNTVDNLMDSRKFYIDDDTSEGVSRSRRPMLAMPMLDTAGHIFV